MTMVTKAEIERAKTPAGGWTREQLAAWGVPWPPPKGWRKCLEAGRSGRAGNDHRGSLVDRSPHR
jgi:hypothetical protein